MQRFVRQRQGITSLLAMLYLVLFATLAIGFYSATNTSVIVVDNEKRGALALVAAESGMEFIRYQLAQVTIPYGTTQAQLFSTVTTQLSNQLNGTANLTGKSIAVTSTSMSVPAGSDNYITLDSSGAK